MLIPKAESAEVSGQKIVDYLLNLQHPDGASKAKFFHSLGFRADRWQELATALKRLAMTTPVAETIETQHGRKYIIEGEITSSAGNRAHVRTVWIIDIGQDTPRLVTAYPN